MTGGPAAASSDSLLARVTDRLRDSATAATDPRLTVGDSVLLVEVTDPEEGRLAGLAHRPPGNAVAVEDSRVADLEASPTTTDLPDLATTTELADLATATEPADLATTTDLADLPPVTDSADLPPVTELTELATAADGHLEQAVGVATLNALSVPEMDWRSGDPMAALSADVDVVATVGLFRPAFRKFESVEVRVVEREESVTVDAPADVSVTTHRPGDCRAAFDGADVCFLTGSTLVYGGIDRYLTALSAAGVSPVVLVGATASHLPGPAFAAGVDVVAGARITDVERVRERVAAGDCGTDLHDDGVEKVYVADSTVGDDLPGLTLAAAAQPRNPSNTDCNQ